MATVDSLEDPPTERPCRGSLTCPQQKESSTRDPHQTSDLLFAMSSTSDDEGAAMLHEALRVAESTGAPRRSLTGA